MPLEHREGDLFNQPDLEALAQGVNTVGRMGAGIAVLFRRRHPAMYEAYADMCRNGELRVGGVFSWRSPSDGLWIYNLASQHYTGADARLDAIATSLTAAVEHAEQNFVSSIGLPRIGAGIGGLDWSDVLDVFDAIGRNTTVRLAVVSLPGE